MSKEILDDELKKLLDAHLKLINSDMKVHLEHNSHGVAKFSNPSAVKLKLAMQGDDGTLASAVDVIQSYEDEKDGV